MNVEEIKNQIKDRESKFRAYSFLEEKMVYDVIPISNKVYGLELEAMGPDVMEIELRDGYVTEYTGIKDCNEKEIYEGDIVKIYGRGKKIVQYRKCLYFDGSGAAHPGFYFKTRYDEIDWHESLDETAEVVGNIFEDEEMVKSIEI